MDGLFDAGELGAAALAFLGFVGALFVGRRLCPGPERLGQPLKDGTRKRYRLNGLFLFLLLGLTIAAGQRFGFLSLAWVARHFWPLFVVSNLFSLAHTLWLFARGRRARQRRGADDTGLLHDLWFGPELNPELGGVDLKMFAYLPSLMGLWVVNLSFAAVQSEALGHLTGRMILYQVLFTVYVFNYFQFEYGMLHTWDVIAENFGFMLCWGDYTFVPFFYSLSGWYLVSYEAPLSAGAALGSVLLFAVGFVLFRGANEQKHRYKEDPTAPIWGRPPEAVGGRLLCSGFWGIGRKLNYTGELCIYFAWTLLTGAQSLVPYLVPLWLLGLFSHRAWRDEQRCRRKYGPLWSEYCRRARFRMFPFVY